jgi:hypothetical protein
VAGFPGGNVGFEGDFAAAVEKPDFLGGQIDGDPGVGGRKGVVAILIYAEIRLANHRRGRAEKAALGKKRGEKQQGEATKHGRC